jgi:AraC-like DNA-binding protein
VPVIVLTAQNLTAEVMERLNRGVASVLGKGIFNQDEILAQVQAALARSKRLGSAAQRIARRAMAYIHEHYREPITRQEMAGALGVNERYLTRCFHDETGLPPMAYLSRHRVKQAKKLLDEEAMSITEVALETGFSSSAYFSRVFHQETGMTPLKYRYRKHSPSG